MTELQSRIRTLEQEKDRLTGERQHVVEGYEQKLSTLLQRLQTLEHSLSEQVR